VSDLATLLDFWFAPGREQQWYKADPGFDAEIRARFGRLHDAAAAGALDHWAVTAHGALALLILLDQFPRNMFRGTPRAFACDAKAQAVTLHALDRGFDAEVGVAQRPFVYLPLEHAEDLPLQERSCALFAAMGDAKNLDYACRHRDIIARFARFPHRNAALGRMSTAEELTFLAEPDSAF